MFAEAGIDPSKFRVRSGKDLKRTVRKYGKVLGHQDPHTTTTVVEQGMDGPLLTYVEARLQIYLPAYDQVLARYTDELATLRERWTAGEKICLVDYNTNEDVYDED